MSPESVEVCSIMDIDQNRFANIAEWHQHDPPRRPWWDRKTLTDDEQELQKSVTNGDRVRFDTLLLDPGVSCLIRVFTDYHQLVTHAVIFDNIEVITRLLDKGVHVDSVSDNGLTALHTAAKLSNVAAAKILLERGANPNLRCNKGFSALEYVIKEGIDCHSRNRPENVQMVYMLLQAGVDPDGGNHFLALTMSIHDFAPHTTQVYELQQIFQMLIDCGAPIDRRIYPEIEMDHPVGNTPLLKAVKRGRMRSMQQCIDNGADINLADEDGVTPLQVCNTSFAEGIFILQQQQILIEIDNRDVAARVALEERDVPTEIIDEILQFSGTPIPIQLHNKLERLAACRTAIYNSLRQ